MTNKLRSILVSLAVVGAASAAVAQGGNLIGERYAAVDLAYIDYDDGGHMTTGVLTLNVPSTIKGLDLGIDIGYGDGGYGSYDQSEWVGEAYGVYYSRQDGFTPYITAGVGYDHVRGELMGYSASESSFLYKVGAGVEVPLTEKASIDVGVTYSDVTKYSDGDSVEAHLRVNYAITEKMWLRVGYTRDFDNDANTVSVGMAFRY